MKKHFRKLLYIALFLLICWFSGSLYFTYKLTHRFCDRYEEAAIPAGKENIFERIKYLTSDSLEIHGVMANNIGSSTCVLILHGNGGNYAENYELMDSLYNDGISSLSISLRCHGSSGGTLNDIGYSAGNDVAGAVKFIKSTSRCSRIILAGRSLGSASAMFGYDSIAGDVNGFLLESPYYNLEKAVKYRLRYYFPGTISNITFLNLNLFSKFYISDIDKISPYLYSNKMQNAKVVFIGGSNDVKAPLPDIALMAGNIPGSKVVSFAGAEHELLFKYNRKKYFTLLLDLCNQQ